MNRDWTESTNRRTRGIRAGAVMIALLLAGALTPAAPRDVAGADDTVPVPWGRPIREMDEALERGDVRAALRAREDARLAALASLEWEGMVVVGDATLRLARSAGLLPAMEPAVRRAYQSALLRARRQGSLDGVLRVTEAFATLGDREMARKGFAVARTLAIASREAHALDRVRALEQRLDAALPQVRASLPSRGAGDGGSHGTE
jgi:hypothetical protein